MCKRYVISDQADVEQEFHLSQPWWKFSASFNVSTARNVPVIRMHQGDSEGVMLRWGLIPDWAEGDASKACGTHARAEEIERSRLVRGAWSRGQRCILPLSGFYCWQLTQDRYRQPFFIRLVNRPVFGIAALWDRTVQEEADDVLESCALLTVPPNPLMAEVDNTAARMPAILHREDYELWLNASAGLARSVLCTHPQDRMVAYPVSPRINSLEYDDVWLTQRIEVERSERYCA